MRPGRHRRRRRHGRSPASTRGRSRAGPISAGTRCEGGWNFVDDSAQAYDDQGHGTHVAGTIAQTTNNGVGAAGLAFCASLMPIKVLSKHGFGTVANVAEGIRFAADEGAQVINLSLGGPIKSAILEDAVDHALAHGVVVVAAAGNSGRSVGWPAAYPGVVAVSATDDTDKIAWFSSRGPEVAIAAPGVGVTQQTVCNGGRDKCEIFGTFNGTSMASPHVAGVAAMIEALGVTRASARSARSSSRPRVRRPKGRSEQLYGAGILDAGGAMAHVFWSHLGLRVVALAGLAWLVRRRIVRRGGKVARLRGALLGALRSRASGSCLSRRLLGLLTHAGKLRDFVELAMRPLGEWDASSSARASTAGSSSRARCRPSLCRRSASPAVACVRSSAASRSGPQRSWCRWRGRPTWRSSGGAVPARASGRSPTRWFASGSRRVALDAKRA